MEVAFAVDLPEIIHLILHMHQPAAIRKTCLLLFNQITATHHHSWGNPIGKTLIVRLPGDVTRTANGDDAYGGHSFRTGGAGTTSWPIEIEDCRAF